MKMTKNWLKNIKKIGLDRLWGKDRNILRRLNRWKNCSRRTLGISNKIKRKMKRLKELKRLTKL